MVDVLELLFLCFRLAISLYLLSTLINISRLRDIAIENTHFRDIFYFCVIMLLGGIFMTNKIKQLLKIANKRLKDYATFTQRSQSNVSNKAVRGSWTLDDAIKLAEFTNTRLAFVDENEKVVIVFDSEDIK